jgi:hypothetical protein
MLKTAFVMLHVLFVKLFNQRLKFDVEKYPTASEGTIPILDVIPTIDVPIDVDRHVNEFAVGMLAIVNVPSSVPVPDSVTSAPTEK